MPATDAGPPAPPAGGARATPSRWLDRIGALVRELGKFGVVGGTAFAIDLAIFNVLLRSGSETLTAKTISTLVATTVAFAGNRLWTWRHRERRGLAREYSMFFLLNAVGLGIGLGCLALSHYALGAVWPALRSQLADNVSGQLVGTGLGTLFRFWSYRRFVFRVAVAPVAGLPAAAGPARQPLREQPVTEPPATPLGSAEHRPAM